MLAMQRYDILSRTLQHFEDIQIQKFKKIKKQSKSLGLIIKNNDLKFKHMKFWKNSPNKNKLEKIYWTF